MKKIFIIPVLALLIILSSCEKEVSVSPPEGPAPEGFYYINSFPQGAEIWQDGIFTGNYSPDSMVHLEYDVYEITLKKPFFRDTTFLVDASKDEPQNIFVNYLENPRMLGKINCESRPVGAQIFLNDSATGKVAPVILDNIVPGQYKIRYELEGFRDFDTEIIVNSNRVTQYERRMQDTTIWVDHRVLNSGLETDYINAVVTDDKNNLWVGSDGYGLFFFNGIEWKKYSQSNSRIPSNKVTALAFGNDQTLWVGTAAGIAKMQNNIWTVFNIYNSRLPNNNIEDIEIDLEGDVWIATGRGVVRISNDKWAVYKPSIYIDELPVSPRDIAVDIYNNKWIADYDDAIYEYSQSKWTRTYNNPPYTTKFLPSNKLTAVEAAPDGTVWFAHSPFTYYFSYSTIHEPGGLTNLVNGEFVQYISGLPSNYINVIHISPNNIKYVGTESGIVIFENYAGRKEYQTYNSNLMSNYITDITQDANGTVWISTFGGGVVKYKGEVSK